MLNFWIRYGSWGVCYTYGTWFGIKGLVAGGRTYHNTYNIRRACDFLLSKQLDSGGWGESYLSCQNKVRKNLLFVWLIIFSQMLFHRWLLIVLASNSLKRIRKERNWRLNYVSIAKPIKQVEMNRWSYLLHFERKRTKNWRVCVEC